MPVGILMTPAIRSSILCIVLQSGTPPAQPCSGLWACPHWDWFGSEEGWGGAARVKCHLQSSLHVLQHRRIPRGNWGGVTARTLLRTWGSKRLQYHADCWELPLLSFFVVPIELHKTVNYPSRELEQSLSARLTSYNSPKGVPVNAVPCDWFFLLRYF